MKETIETLSMYAIPPPPPMVWVIPSGGSSIYPSPIVRDFTTSTVSLPYSPPVATKKVVAYLRSRFKKVSFSQANQSLLMADIQEQRIFNRPWVKLNLVIIISPRGSGSTLTVLAIAWGERGINPPSIWDEQINPSEVSRWISSQLIPFLKSL